MSGRMYGRRWSKARAFHLLHNPLCVMCKSLGTLTPADVVDHRVPHRGDAELFWDPKNWQSLCEHHHNSVKQAWEKADHPGYTSLGEPINPAKGW